AKVNFLSVGVKALLCRLLHCGQADKWPAATTKRACPRWETWGSWFRSDWESALSSAWTTGVLPTRWRRAVCCLEDGRSARIVVLSGLWVGSVSSEAGAILDGY